MSTSINPSSLSFHSPSPEPSSSSNKRSVSPSESDSHSNAGSSRKRQRTDLSAEERKDARMHRNRIAAQNSRDRRKAHYAHLEQRVAELEEENRRLRAGMAVPSVLPHRSETEKVEEREREKAKERENEELRERIRTLEKGWEAVVKALAAQGLPTGLSTALSSTSSEPLPPSNIPTIVPTTPMFPISPPSTLASLTSSPSCFVPSPSMSSADEFEPTRHLARVATIDPTSMPLQRVDSIPISSISTLAHGTSTTNSTAHNSLTLRRRRIANQQSMKQLWKIFSVRSSRLLPPSRRRLYLLTSPSHHPHPSPLQHKSRPPPRPPRRK
ncbi:hypothetical protein JAAARDRAFT_331142 [Jaapia argillacea MUCL 33604]|uniref:X-box-binding protein 1 n=1 Tax=Jaapia argillacea MUCL 33604 TaxID=933084 RepID=A0A067PLY1_9AGAM|nr:hypothetical protein JAAARDRAFT_331142 [Jaapia argillacea MUCL 33604]